MESSSLRVVFAGKEGGTAGSVLEHTSGGQPPGQVLRAEALLPQLGVAALGVDGPPGRPPRDAGTVDQDAAPGPGSGPTGAGIGGGPELVIGALAGEDRDLRVGNGVDGGEAPAGGRGTGARPRTRRPAGGAGANADPGSAGHSEEGK